MRIQAIPLHRAKARPNPGENEVPDAPAVPPNEDVIQSGPVVIYTYGKIGTADTQAEP